MGVSESGEKVEESQKPVKSLQVTAIINISCELG